MAATLSGKVAVITGGTKGIGASIAKLLVSQGAKVVVSYSGDDKAAESVVKELGADSVTAVKADCGSLAGIDTLVDATVQKHQKIDILIPNAGVLMLIQDIAQLTEESYDKSYNLNVKGPMFLVQKALPYIPEGGRIIFVSTTQDFASTVTL